MRISGGLRGLISSLLLILSSKRGSARVIAARRAQTEPPEEFAWSRSGRQRERSGRCCGGEVVSASLGRIPGRGGRRPRRLGRVRLLHSLIAATRRLLKEIAAARFDRGWKG